jgi:hypothetical protein
LNSEKILGQIGIVQGIYGLFWFDIEDYVMPEADCALKIGRF